MGEFAKKEINNVVDSLKNRKLIVLAEEYQERLKHVTDSNEKLILKNKIKNLQRKLKIETILDSKYDADYCKKVIELVGGP